MAQNDATGFLANAGQMKNTDGTANNDLLFSSHAGGAKVFLTKTGISFAWYKAAVDTAIQKDSTYRMEIEFNSANKSVSVVGSNLQPSYSNYFVGSVSAPNVAEYGKVTYKNLWPNIDLELNSDSNGFSFKYLLAKGANPADIQLKYNGGNKFASKTAGLSIDVPFGKNIEFTKFNITKTSGTKGLAPTVSSSFSNSTKLAQTIVTNYNSNESYEIVQSAKGPGVPPPIVIKTNQNRWTTYYGGALDDEVKDIFTDQANNIYVIGTTISSIFPVPIGSIQDVKKSFQDIFVARFRADRSRAFSTYFGGNGRDDAASIAVNSLGQIYFCGFSSSTDYPAQSNGNAYYVPTKTAISTGVDGVISMLNNNGNTILWSTYFGVNSQTWPTSISINSTGKVYMTGWMESSAISLPTVPLPEGYYQPFSQTFSGSLNSFIVRFANVPSGIDWCTYFGGLSNTIAISSAIDLYDNFILLSRSSNLGTISNVATGNGTLPITGSIGSYVVNNSGGQDLLITKFQPNGKIEWSTFYGGSLDEGAGVRFNDASTNSIATSAINGDIYLCSTTKSINLPGPSLYTGNQSSFGGGITDAFLVRFNNLGIRKFATFIGGSGDEEGLAVSQYKGLGYLAGGTTTSGNFPTYNDNSTLFDGIIGGTQDGFLNQYDNTNIMRLSTFVGGAGVEKILSIDDASSTGIEAFTFVGSTSSVDFPVNDLLGLADYIDLSYNGANDGFIMDIKYCPLGGCKLANIESNSSTNYSIYPNPSNGIINISNLETNSRIEIINAMGQKIMDKKMNPSILTIEIDLSNYSKGLYFVKVQSDLGIETYKIILQ